MFSLPLYPTQQEQTLTQLINNHPESKAILLTVSHLISIYAGNSEIFVAAGFLRNLFWDFAHQHKIISPLDDVDVVYFDSSNIKKVQDITLENHLKQLMPQVSWSVKNQARMHNKSGHAPYTSLNDALSNWVETATAIGVRVDADNRLKFIAPWGFQDLFDLVLKPTPFFEQKLEVFHQRVKQKQWLEKWPKLKVVTT